ncbi:MAG: MAPEG family protein [Dongiaceae bacterium]
MPIDYSPDLQLLVWAAALCVVQMLVAVAGATLQVGLPRLAGNRDPLPELTGWVGRATRAHRNMLENLVLFATLVIVAHIAGAANETTVLGAQLFFWARLVYAIIYLAGIPWVRTAVWAVSMVGLIIIFLQLV